MRMYKLVNFRSKNLLKNNAGFTLIEVLIAIILLAFISLYTFKMVDNSTDTKDRVLKEDQVLLQGLTAISRIDIDISQLYSPLYYEQKSTPATDPNLAYQDSDSNKGSFDGKTKSGQLIPQFQSDDKSSITFLTTSNRRKISDTKESRYKWVKYSVRKSEHEDIAADDKKTNSHADNELIRQTISTNIYNRDLNWSDVKAQILLTQIKNVEFTFWDERTKKYVTSLQDLNENKSAIRSVKLEIIWIDDNNHEQKIEKIFRILTPYFNSKLDAIGTGGAYGDSSVPPGVPDPNDPTGGQTNQGGSQGGGTGVHY